MEVDQTINIDYQPWTVTMCGKTYATVVRGGKMRIIKVREYL